MPRLAYRPASFTAVCLISTWMISSRPAPFFTNGRYSPRCPRQHAAALGVQRHVPSGEICPRADFFPAAYGERRGGRALVDRHVGGDDLDVGVAQYGIEEAWLGPTGAEVKLTRGQERNLFRAPTE